MTGPRVGGVNPVVSLVVLLLGAAHPSYVKLATTKS